MMRAVVIAFVLSLLAVPAAYADLQYWVTIGSFKTNEAAERSLSAAQAKLSDNFSVVGVSTGKGYYYRVATGPYLTRELADDRVRSALAQGYGSAWIWTEESDTFTSDYSVDLPDYESDVDLDYDARKFESESDLIDNSAPTPGLVDEAPEGFNLNKMRRDARLMQPLGPHLPAVAAVISPPDQFS